mgnify:FL=1
MTLPTPTADQLQAMAEELVQRAQTAGLVLTVEQVNLQPPRIGNYKTVVSVRPERSPS